MVVELIRGPTAVRIYCNQDRRLSDNPEISIHPWLKNNLIEYEYDPREKRSFVKYNYYRYERETGILHLPVNLINQLIDYLKDNGAEYKIIPLDANPSITFDIDLTANFEKREYQEKAAEFLISDGHMKALSLQTGDGKTLVAIKVIVALRQRSLIVLPAFLVDQWTKVFSNITTAKIDVIRGSKSIFNLINNDYQSDANIFLASINTIYEYAIRNSQYESAPSFQTFIRKLGIGIKIVDECHLNFHANTMIDIQSDVKHNIYLSATHMRSAKNSERIFQRIYPEEIRYKNSNRDNYINITEVRFSIGDIPEFFYKTVRGYSHFKYEKYLLKKIGRLNYLVEKVFEPLVEEYFITIRKPNQKLLILVALTEFGNLISEWLKTRYPDLKVSTYFNETPNEILETSDIIVSTIGSCGTGKDIKGLRTVILTTSFSAETLTLQTVGRLRKMEDTPEFVYLVNTAIGQQIRHAKIRSEIYSGIAKKFRSVVF